MGCSSSVASNQPAQQSPGNVRNKQGRRLSTAPMVVAHSELPPALGEIGFVPPRRSELENETSEKLPSIAVSYKGKAAYNKKKMNQDRAMIKYCLKDDPGIHIFGVMDGHGEFGHHVSNLIQDRLPKNIAELDIRANPEKAMLAGVEATCSDLAKSGLNIDYSGTTLVFGVMVDRRLYVGNIGDSRVICIKNKDGNGVAHDLSKDHKPDSPGEQERIIKAGGRVAPLPGLPAGDCGPMRVWLKEHDVPGLAMARSIGDAISHLVGVIDVPEITVYDIAAEDVFLVFASDGVWEFLESQPATDIVWKEKDDLEDACKVLCDKSTEHWEANEEVIDDITAVMVQVNPL